MAAQLLGGPGGLVVGVAQVAVRVDLVLVMLSWIFVVTRFANAGVLASSNDGRTRSLAWFAGVLVVFAMWVYFALKTLLPI